MGRRRNRGFSIIDATLSIVLISFSYVTLGSVLSWTSLKSADLEIANTALLLARGKMAQETALSFGSVADVSATNFGGDFSKYQYVVNVDYVDASDLNTSVTGPTDYKRIEVIVSATGWNGSIKIYDLVTNVN